MVKQAQVRCGDRLTNPPAVRKEALVKSLNLIPIPHGKKCKTTPSHILGLNLHYISIRASRETVPLIGVQDFDSELKNCYQSGIDSLLNIKLPSH